MTQEKTFNVLFLCAGNSARSIMAEVLMGRWGKGRFRAWSAGSHPAGEVHPRTLALLNRFNLPTQGLRSKSWDELTVEGAPELDFVFTVCDRAASETCPVWPGRPITAHWSVEAPVAVTGDDAAIDKAFRNAFLVLEARIKLFTALRIETLDSLTLRRQLDAIGGSRETAA